MNELEKSKAAINKIGLVVIGAIFAVAAVAEICSGHVSVGRHYNIDIYESQKPALFWISVIFQIAVSVICFYCFYKVIKREKDDA